jgi:extracellular elastinolytic metalloproteinase
MEDNWYDAVVSARDSNILSVVDWASDSPMPLYLPVDMASLPPLESEKKKPKKPVPPPKKKVDPTYHVFPWGTNDPEEGNRSTLRESKSADTVASPYGWHSIPLGNVPYELRNFAPLPIPDNTVVNFTTTLGNNVFAQENWEGQNAFVSNYRPDAGNSLNFTFKYSPKDRDDSEGRMREARDHINATVTQLFYTTNMFHDLMYRSGSLFSLTRRITD